MTDSKTDYHENQVMDRIFANSATDGSQAGVYVALWTSNPTNSPNTSNEVGGGSYSRQHVRASGWSVVSANNPRKYDNDNDINFGALDSNTEYTISGVVLYGGSNSASAVYRSTLSSAKTVAGGDEFKFSSGDLDVSED